MPRLTLKLHGAGPAVVVYMELPDADPRQMQAALEAAAARVSGKRAATRLGTDARLQRTFEPDSET